MTTLPGHLRGDGPCQDCGTVDTIVWFTESPLWNTVMGGPEATSDPGGLLCIPCFVARVDAAGLEPTGWRLIPEWPWATRTTEEQDRARRSEAHDSGMCGGAAAGCRFYPCYSTEGR